MGLSTDPKSPESLISGSAESMAPAIEGTIPLYGVPVSPIWLTANGGGEGSLVLWMAGVRKGRSRRAEGEG